jgi:hypothetical protein
VAENVNARKESLEFRSSFAYTDDKVINKQVLLRFISA